MLPFVIAGVALATAILSGCGSDPQESSNHSPPEPKDADNASGPRSNSSGTGFENPIIDDTFESAPRLSASALASSPPRRNKLECRRLPDEAWRYDFKSGVLMSRPDVQAMRGSSLFCTHSRLNIGPQSCKGIYQSFPLKQNPGAVPSRTLQVLLDISNGLSKCMSFLSIKEETCPADFANPKCGDQILFFQMLPNGTMLSLLNLLEGDGNDDEAADLLVELSDGRAVFIAQDPASEK